MRRAAQFAWLALLFAASWCIAPTPKTTAKETTDSKSAATPPVANTVWATNAPSSEKRTSHESAEVHTQAAAILVLESPLSQVAPSTEPLQKFRRAATWQRPPPVLA